MTNFARLTTQRLFFSRVHSNDLLDRFYKAIVWLRENASVVEVSCVCITITARLTNEDLVLLKVMFPDVDIAKVNDTNYFDADSK